MHTPSNLITAFSLAASLLLVGCGDKSPEERIQSAQEALRTADYKTATIELKDTLQRAPDNTEARLLLGMALQAQEQWAASEKELRKALEFGASPDEVLPRLARTLVEMGQFQEAADLDAPKSGMGSQALASLMAQRATALIALNNADAAAEAINAGDQALARTGATDSSDDLQLAKARLAYIHKRRGEAIQLLDAILLRSPKSIDALYVKAWLLQAEGKDAETLETYQRIVASAPTQIRALIAIAALHQKTGDIDASDKAVKAAEKIAPNVPVVMYARATVLLRAGKIKEANETILRVLQLQPRHLPSLLLEAATSYELGIYEKCRKNAEYILAQLPGNFSAAKLLAASQIKLDDAKGALATLAPFLNAHQGDLDLLAIMGEAHLVNRDYTKAMEYVERAAKLSPTTPAIKNQQAAIHIARRETDQAISALEKATNLTDQPRRADMSLILLQLGKGDFDRAQQAIAILDKKLPNNPVTHNLRAAAYLGKKDYPAARKSLEKALALDPKFFSAAANLARLDLKEGNPDAARGRYLKLLEADKRNVQAMLALADLAASNALEKEQVDWLTQAIKSDPRALQAHTRLVGYYLSKNEKNKALSLAKDAVSQSQDNPDALALLGATQLATGENKAALATFTTLARKAPTSAFAHYQLAMAELAANNTAAAYSALEKALQLRPDYSQAQDALIRLQLANAKPDAALALARQIQARQPNSPFGFDREADIHFSQKRYTQAGKGYQQAIDRGAGTASLIKLHRALVLSGDGKMAEQRMSAWINRYPKDGKARAYAAQHYMSTGRNKEAIAQYVEIQRQTPNNILVLNNLAYLYHSEKDRRALAIAEQALKLTPDNATIQDTLGWILVEQEGQARRGLDLLRKAIAKAPGQATMRYHYAVALAKTGDTSQARNELERLLKDGRVFPEVEAARALYKSL